MKKIKLLLSLMAVITATASINAQQNKVFKFTIEGMSCTGCANSSQKTLLKLKGVDSAFVDFDTKQAIVYAGGKLDEESIKKAISAINFEALFDNDKIVEPLTENEKKGLDIEMVKGGNKMDFKKYLAKGKITLFDFYADWCAPCKLYSPKLERLLLENPGLALRKVDLVSWESELAKQLTKAYKLPSLPFTLLFDENGKLINKVEGNNIEQVKNILKL